MLVMFPLNHENGQIIRTKFWLYEALGELLREQPFSEITVGHLCKRADVSRTVFYNHYENKEALLIEVFTRIMTVYWTKLKLSADENGRVRSRTAYYILCRELMRSREFLRHLPKNGYSHLLVQFFIDVNSEGYRLIARQPPPDSPEYREYFVLYHANAMSCILFRWLCGDNPIPPEQMADIAVRLYRSSNVDAFLDAPFDLYGEQTQGEFQGA